MCLVCILGLAFVGFALWYYFFNSSSASRSFIQATADSIASQVIYPSGPVPPNTPALKAVLMGCNYLGDPNGNELRGCIDDVDDAKTLVVSQYGFNQIIYETDNVPTLQPSANNMAVAMFGWLPSGNVAGSSLYLHYSGHGTTMGQQSGVNPGDVLDAVCPKDYYSAGMITSDQIYQNLVVPLANQQVRLTAVFDSCFSGTCMDLSNRYTVDDSNGYQIVHTSVSTRLAQNDDILFLSGCSDTEESEDVQSMGPPHGALSDAFFNVLKNANYNISQGDLLVGIHKYLNAQGNTSQHPQFGSSKPLDLSAPFSLVYGTTRHLR